MAKTIPQLTDATTVNAADELIISQGGVTKRATGAELAKGLNEINGTVNVRDFGAVGDGVADDTAAIQAAIDSIGVSGGAVIVPHSMKLYCASSVTLKPNVRVSGVFDHGICPSPSSDYYALGCQIKLGTGATLFLERNACLKNLLIIRSGLYASVPTNSSEAVAVVGNFAGTAVQIGTATPNVGNDASVVDCLILGHEYGIKCISSDRISIEHTRIDCTNGVDIDTSFDINRLYAVHCWPFLTAAVSGVGNTPNTPDSNRRTGNGFRLNNYCDWTSLIDCFAYGYTKGYVANDVSNVGFVRCQADYTNPNTGSVCGFEITGNSTITSLTGCTSIAAASAVVVNTTGGSSADSAVRITACVFASTGACVDVQNGNVTCTTSSFQSGTYAANMAEGADASAFVACILDGVAQDFNFANDNVKFSTSLIANVYNTVSITQPERTVNNNVVVQNGSAAFIEVFDRRALAAGVGSTLVGSQLYAAGKQNSFSIRGSLVSATAANEACNLVFAVNSAGSLTDRLTIKHSGVINMPSLPVSAAGLSAGDLWNDGGTLQIVT